MDFALASLEYRRLLLDKCLQCILLFQACLQQQDFLQTQTLAAPYQTLRSIFCSAHTDTRTPHDPDRRDTLSSLRRRLETLLLLKTFRLLASCICLCAFLCQDCMPFVQACRLLNELFYVDSFVPLPSPFSLTNYVIFYHILKMALLFFVYSTKILAIS